MDSPAFRGILPQMRSKIELAWAAGFFDGEGCVSITKCIRRGGTHHGLRVDICQTNEEVLDVFYKVVGERGSQHSFSFDKPNWQTKYSIIYCGRPAVNVLRKLLPYLVLKADQARLGIRLQERLWIPKNRRLGLSDEELMIRDQMWQEIAAMKNRRAA